MTVSPTPHAGARSAGPSVVEVDRREFLKLAGAAGLSVAGTAVLGTATFGQGQAPAASGALVPAADPIADVAASLGHDLERIFRFVADEVRYEPYAGVLRGARGTLAARAGNSADQAILLADMLRASSIPVRFVMGTLDAAAVDALMATTVTDAQTAGHQAQQAVISDDDLAAGLAWALPDGNQPGKPARLPTLADFRSALEADRGATRESLARLVEESLGTITNALGTAGIDIVSGTTVMPQLEQTAHTWVQASDGSSWADLDPSSPGAEPGVPLAATGEPVDALPDEHRHRVDFTVIAETLLGGALTQAPKLEVSAFTDDLGDAGVLFTHVPTRDLAGIDLIGSGVGSGTMYNVVLAIGPELFIGRDPISIGGSGGGDLFGDALGGGGGEGIVEGETGAEWLEVRVSPPFAEARSARRTVFDPVGAMRETGLDPYAIYPAEFIDVGDGTGAHFLPCRGLRAFAVSSGPTNLKAIIERADVTGPDLLPLLARSVDALRDVLAVDVAAPLGSRPFADSPNITSWVFDATPDGYDVGIDIWHRSVGALGVEGASPAVPPAMLAGVIPHALERIILGEASSSGPPQPGESQVSVGAIFKAAASQAVPVLVLSGSVPDDASFTPEHRASVQTALDAGSVVVVPARAITFDGRPRLGWWRIDPVTGGAVDQRDDGAGASGENAVMIATALTYGSIIAQRALDALARNPRLLNDVQFMLKLKQLTDWLTMLGG